MDAKIDYNTCNIIIPIKKGDEEVNIFIPPLNETEIKSNALVLGKFIKYTEEINPLVLMRDYDIYLEEAIEDIAGSKYNMNDPYKEKYKNELNIKIKAMLERILQGGYYLENKELKSIDTLDNSTLETIKSSLLFFIVLFRYLKPQLKAEDWKKQMEFMKVSFTSSSATEWKNTFTIPLSKTETSEE